MIALMVKDDYIDLIPNYPYEVARVFSSRHIKLKGSPRRYCSSSFELYLDGKKLTHDEAYLVCLEDSK